MKIVLKPAHYDIQARLRRLLCPQFDRPRKGRMLSMVGRRRPLLQQQLRLQEILPRRSLPWHR